MSNAPKVAISARTVAARLASLNVPFDAAALMRASGCSSSTAQTVLGKMFAEKALDRPAHGFYCKPGLIPKHTPRPGGDAFVALARGENEAKARFLAEVDAFLADKSPWPGCTTPLPAARPPAHVERGYRRAL